jgi:hypothetical protein
VAIYNVAWHWFSAGGGYTTIQVNIPPAYLGATVALHGVSGGGTSYAGIPHYRRRHEDGRDEDIDFGGDWNYWPPNIVDTVSSVTFGLIEGDDQAGYLVARMDYWR